MQSDGLIGVVSGALVFAYAVAGAHFLQFWRRTGDRLFTYFAVAFWLFAVNQLAVSVPLVTRESGDWVYLLRIAGFVLILVAILNKNRERPPR